MMTGGGKQRSGARPRTAPTRLVPRSQPLLRTRRCSPRVIPHNLCEGPAVARLVGRQALDLVARCLCGVGLNTQVFWDDHKVTDGMDATDLRPYLGSSPRKKNAPRKRAQPQHVSPKPKKPRVARAGAAYKREKCCVDCKNNGTSSATCRGELGPNMGGPGYKICPGITAETNRPSCPLSARCVFGTLRPHGTRVGHH